ncbi:unnamed protein product [Ilex paraguariensis]|uniref:Uncharacterized protein n=1 Tax=Ilex paraguariensis TaxID=185542 RepID=A0ABC8UQQ0_9AQUA
MDITAAWWLTWVLGALPLLIGVFWWWNDLYYMVTLRARFSATGTKLPPGYMGIPFLGELPTFLWYFKVFRRPDDFINSKCHSSSLGG